MGAAYRFRAAIALCALWCASGLGAQAAPALTLGWAELDVSALGAEYRHVGALAPRLLSAATAFARLRLHDGPAGPGELDRGRELESARQAVAKARAALDQLVIGLDDPDHRRAETLKARAAWKAARSALLAILSRTPIEGREAAGASSVRPLQPWSGHRDGKVLPPADDPAKLCAEQGLDILVYGSARQLSGFLAISIKVYIAASETTLDLPEEYGPPDDLSPALEALVRPLASALMGRQYARLILSIEPASAQVRFLGQALEARELIYFEDREGLLTVRAPNHVAHERDLSISPGQDYRLDIGLVGIEGASFTVDSEPQGASVYVDGSLAGHTPLELPVSEALRVARLSMDGMEDSVVLLEPNADALPILRLLPDDGLGFKGRFAKAKDGFYASLGYFVASLPLSVLSYGAFVSYRGTLLYLEAIGGAGIDQERTDSLLVGYYGSQIAFWSSAAVSAALAVNAVIRLVVYIRSAD